jgi:regulator of sigma E protease
MITIFSHISSYIWLALGFGFVIFFHELGHFLTAKWAGVKVEQFAVGFGPAIFSWRKGLGLRPGSSRKEYDEKLHQHLLQGKVTPVSQSTDLESNSRPRATREETHDFTELELSRASDELGLGETEYRLNWIPLGGYVKMLGQDDLNPNATTNDPRSFNMKPVSKRMVIVSAGVIMNIILAAIGFMILFLIGFHVPPAIVGGVMPGSPAQQATTMAGKPAPVQVGDQILRLDGKPQYDFTKISLDTALLADGETAELDVLRRNGQEQHLLIKPARIGGENSNGFLMLGIEQPRELLGPDQHDYDEQVANTKDIQHMVLPSDLALHPGDVITAVNGQRVTPRQFWKLDEALQQSLGSSVQVTVKDAAGKTREIAIAPSFEMPFSDKPLNFAGMQPRSSVTAIMDGSPALDKILPGDVILKMNSGSDVLNDPSNSQFKKWLEEAGDRSQPVILTVLRNGQTVTLPPIIPSYRIGPHQYGLNIGLDVDAMHPVIADVEPDSPASVAGIEGGSTITAIDGQEVTNWFQAVHVLSQAQPATPIKITGQTRTGTTKTWQLTLTSEQIATLSGNRAHCNLGLRDMIEVRQTTNPLTAAKWGVGETRDFILQFYLTLQRMAQRSVSYTNMMGPVGIIHYGAQIASRGVDWLLWFLAMISANLAVVNFLPIPIVDGGLFMFLIIEKIQGRPLSPRAQSIAQVVGMALLLGVFLLVTCQDINHIYRIW